MTPRRVILDSVAFLQAASNPNGPAGACWELVKNGKLQHFASESTLLELHDVLSRTNLAKKLRLTELARSLFLEVVRERSLIVETVPAVFKYSRDHDDEPFLNLAIHSAAEYLVTWDKDLLDLMNPGDADGERLKLLAPQLVILTQPDLLLFAAA